MDDLQHRAAPPRAEVVDREAAAPLHRRKRLDVAAREIDDEVRRLVDEAYADAKRVIEENRDRLEELAKALLEKETMDGREVERMVRGEDEAKTEGGEA